MTVNYNATRYGTYENFKSALFESFSSSFKSLTSEDHTLLYEFHSRFYKFLKEDHFKILFTIDKDEFTSIIRDSNWSFKTVDESTIDLRLYKMSKIRTVKTYKIGKEIRSEDSFHRLTDELNTKKMSLGLEPNFIQANDAYLVRKVVSTIPSFSVHDSFGVPLSYQHVLFDTVNSYFLTGLSKDYAVLILL